MNAPPLPPLLDALGLALGMPVRPLSEAPLVVQRAALAAAVDGSGAAVDLTVADECYLAVRYDQRRLALLVAGPYRRDPRTPGEGPVLDPAAEERARAALVAAASASGQVVADERERLELSSRLELLDSAAVAIAGELSLEVVLRRIVDLAREVVGAAYAAIGVADADGQITRFAVSGLTEEEIEHIGPYPCGAGLLGLLIREPQTLRLADLRSHPASIGFPPHHPEMKSFLGVPITAHGRIHGTLYLTEKRFAPEFTDEDVRLVELLARHAGVAIENATLYQQAAVQRQYLQAIINQLPEAVLIVEPNPERVTLANSQTSTLLGWEVTPPLPLDRFLQGNTRTYGDQTPMGIGAVPIVRALRDGHRARSEVTLGRPDGSVITMLVNTAPLLDERGEIIAAVAVFQDISEIKDAERLKDDFLALVSHELRTPVTTIQGGAMVLQNDDAALDEETRRMLLTDIAGESHRLAGLVENMVQITNIRAGRLAMDTEPILVRALVRRAVKAIQGTAPKRHFEVTVAPDLLALGDPERVDQVLRNILQNAVKYGPAGTPVEIEARRNDAMVVIAVRDHGPGIDEEDLPFVFDRFQRGAEARRSYTAGMGLGLYLARQLIEAHDGRIWIEHPPDGGTRVLFSLPAITDDEE